MTYENKGLGGSALPSDRAVSAVPVTIPSADDAFRLGIEYAARHLAGYARSLAEMYEEGPRDPTGWPETIEGAARHELLAFAVLIEECVEHETLSPQFSTLAQAIEARRAETPSGSVHESAVAESDAPNTQDQGPNP